MDSCFHSGEVLALAQSWTTEGDSDVQNCSSAALSRSQIRCATQERDPGLASIDQVMAAHYESDPLTPWG